MSLPLYAQAAGQTLATELNPAGEHILAVGSGGRFSPIVVVDATLQRPNDTTAYAPNDAISNSTSTPSPIAFGNVVPVEGGSGYITKLRVATNNTAWTTPIRVHLYRTSVAARNDNATFNLLFSNIEQRIGAMDVTQWRGAGTGTDCVVGFAEFMGSGNPYSFALPAGSSNIWAQIEILGATNTTPAANQQFKLSLEVQPA